MHSSPTVAITLQYHAVSQVFSSHLFLLGSCCDAPLALRAPGATAMEAVPFAEEEPLTGAPNDEGMKIEDLKIEE